MPVLDILRGGSVNDEVGGQFLILSEFLKLSGGSRGCMSDPGHPTPEVCSGEGPSPRTTPLRETAEARDNPNTHPQAQDRLESA